MKISISNQETKQLLILCNQFSLCVIIVSVSLFLRENFIAKIVFLRKKINTINNCTTYIITISNKVMKYIIMIIIVTCF